MAAAGRRTTRVTRNTDSENVTLTRSSSVVGKATRSTTAAAKNTTAGAALAKDARPALNPRKRSALGDLTNATALVNTALAGGKDGAAKSTTTNNVAGKSTTTTAIGKRTTRARAESVVKDDDVDDANSNGDAMTVDEPEKAPVGRPIRALRPTKASSSSTTTTTTTRAAAGRPALGGRTNSTTSTRGGAVGVGAKKATSATTTTTVAGARARKGSTASTTVGGGRVKKDEVLEIELEEAKEDGTAARAAKRVRTSEPDPAPVAAARRVVGKAVAAGKKEAVKKEEVQDKVEVEEMEMAGEVAEVDEDEVEKELAPQDWDDLDIGDEDDPLMVSLYVKEVYEYLLEHELTTIPDKTYMDRQDELSWEMRGILLDWLIDVHSKFRLLPETIFLASNIIDRFLSVRVVSVAKFQLVGVTALFIASKFEEVVCPSVNNFLYMTDGGYTDDEVLKAERYVLQIINFNLSYPNPLNFLRRISKADGYDIQSRTLAKYLMEITIVDDKFVDTAPSLIAAAAMWFARKVLGKGPWDANLKHYSAYTESALLPTAQLMLEYVALTTTGEIKHANFHKKYASKKFFKASEFVRDWAVDRYGKPLKGAKSGPGGRKWRLEELAK